MDIIKFENIEDRIIRINGEDVILDGDLADLYGVETRDINKAVKNNPDKFPDGYIFELTKEEKNELVENFHRFKLSKQDQAEVVENFHNLEKLKFSPHLPKAFTEKGLYMLATILKSPKATQTTISIIETFAKIKHLTRTIKEISTISDEKKMKNLMQKSGEIIAELLDDNLHVEQSETTIELNFALLKVKHTIKRK